MANLISAFGEFFSMFGILGLPLLLGGIAVFIGIPAYITIAIIKMLLELFRGEPKEKETKDGFPTDFSGLYDLRIEASEAGDDVTLLRATEAIHKLHPYDMFYPYDLYTYYRDGIGTEPNPEKALEYLKLAVELGNNKARMEYADTLVMLELYDKAIALYRECTYDHHKDAPYAVFKLYVNQIIPMGTMSEDQYHFETIRWLLYAATLGHEDAQFVYQTFTEDPETIELMQNELSLAINEKDSGDFAEHILIAALCGNRSAQCVAGRQLTRKENYHDAELFLLASALQDFPLAAFELGNLLIDHIGWFSEGIKWLEKAAELDHLEACESLGIAWFRRGRDCKHERSHESFVNSVKWFRAGAEKGDDFCMFKLATLQENGYGRLPYDRAAIRDWMKKAAALGNESAIEWLEKHDEIDDWD